MSLDFRKLGLWSSFQFRASQFNLEIQVDLKTTARLMFLSEFVPQIFLSESTKHKRIMISSKVDIVPGIF